MKSRVRIVGFVMFMALLMSSPSLIAESETLPATYTVSNSLNVRVSPFVDSRIAGVLKKGSEVFVSIWLLMAGRPSCMTGMCVMHQENISNTKNLWEIKLVQVLTNKR